MVTPEPVPHRSSRNPDRPFQGAPPWHSGGNPGELAGEREDSIDRQVDRLVDSHRAVLATLERDAKELNEHPREAPAGTRGIMAPSMDEAMERHAAPLRKERRERAQRLARFRPVHEPVRLDPPLVTRGGVLYVPPVFEEAAGLDEESATRLVRAGFRTVDLFLRASDQELADAAGRSLAMVRRAKSDLDLMRLPHVDSKTADLLRLAGVSTVSRLAIMDPMLLVRDIERITDRHRFLAVPAALNSERAIRRLATAAQARTE